MLPTIEKVIFINIFYQHLSKFTNKSHLIKFIKNLVAYGKNVFASNSFVLSYCAILLCYNNIGDPHIRMRLLFFLLFNLIFIWHVKFLLTTEYTFSYVPSSSL